jgi:predicted ester cyclase
MSVEEIRSLTHHLFEKLNKGKTVAIAAIDEDFANNIVVHSATGRDMNLKDFKQYLSSLYDAFPDIHFTIDDIFVEGDKIVIRHTRTGTHKGEFLGIPSTNKKVTFWSIEIYRIVDGKLIEAWSRFDTLGLMQQLGAIPTSKK